jgi:hypothetical protein
VNDRLSAATSGAYNSSEFNSEAEHLKPSQS